jgi:hypothetical protein
MAIKVPIWLDINRQFPCFDELAAIHSEVEDVTNMRSLGELENCLTDGGNMASYIDVEPINPSLAMDEGQKDYFQSELLLQILIELRQTRAVLIRMFREHLEQPDICRQDGKWVYVT